MFMKLKTMLLAALLNVCFFTACESAKKTAAEAAINTADSSFQSIAAEAKKYVPDQTKAVQDSLQQAKTSLSNKDYSAALDAAKGLPEKISSLSAAVKAKKDELTAKWNDLKGTMPGLVTAVQSRFDALKKKHALPAGADSKLAGLKQTWDDASSSFQSGDLSSAMEKASAAKEKLAEIQKMLGMKPSS
jgi:hypothetical protein